MKFEYSVGAVVFHKNEFLLLKYGMGHWGFVKGNMEDGEKKEETIKRELREETGITEANLISGFEKSIEYYYTMDGEKIHKKVDYLLINSDTKKVELSYEHDDYKWKEFEEALELLSFKNAKNVLREARDFIEAKV